ncbi:Formamidopyrimidine-DNA glycosylase [Minicystis rosea]|nr:Formamidopyrimidine-DNA glycosylase [Minicystis rosea]
MPERPDLEHVVPILDRELRGQTITDVRVDKPVVLRVALRDPVTVIVGRSITTVRRRAHFVIVGLGGDPALEIVVAPMLAGRFTIAKPDDRRPADLALTLSLGDGRELRYRDDVQMGKVYVIEAGRWDQVPGLAAIGVDVLDPKAFTRPAFRALAKKRKDQVKVFLMDKAALDAMGNAYADEVLWEARLHPKTFVRSLSEAEIDALHDAIVKVLSNARDEIARRAPPLDQKLRDFLVVRNRHGEACPRCGAKIRKAGVHGHDAFFCPECQPDERGAAIVDFRRAKK